MKKFRVLATDGLEESAAESLRVDPRFELTLRKETSAEDLMEFGRNADFIIIRSATKLGPKNFSEFKGLKGVIRAGVGIDNVDLESAKVNGVYVWNAPTGNFLATAEHAVALIFALLRAIPFSHTASRSGLWSKNESSKMGRQIQGTYLGLYGCGNIGSRVARIAHAAGMKVGIYDPYLENLPLGTETLNVDQLLAKSDVISIHSPLTQETRAFFNLERLLKLKKDSYLVNAARGGIVVEADLLKVLSSGHLAGAAMDVFEKEPFSFENPVQKALLEHPRVIATPHIAASTREAQMAVGRECVEKLALIADAVVTGESQKLPRFLVEGDFEKLCRV